MRITREEADNLGRKIGAAMAKAAPPVPVKAPGELLAIFVSGKLVNPLNAHAWGWQKRSRLAKLWKERVAMAVLESGWSGDVRMHSGDREIFVYAVRDFSAQPKRVSFLANVHTLFDDDNLASALKPVRDGLVDCGVIHGDGPKDGHVFVYSQQVDRRNRGVTVRVSLQS